MSNKPMDIREYHEQIFGKKDKPFPQTPERELAGVRERIAKWLFDNTDTVHWDLCGYELSESITEYEHLTKPPEGYDFEAEDVERLEKMHQTLLEKADQILNTPIPIEGGECHHGKDGKIGSWDEKKGKSVRVWCPNCDGTGKLPDKTFTLVELIKEKIG